MSSIELSRIRPSLSRFLTEDSPEDIPPEDLADIFQNSSALHDDSVLSEVHPGWRRELYALMEYPTSSTSAFLLHVSITALIVISTVVTVLETVPAFHSISTRFWFGVETSIVALFTIEYAARCIAWSTSWKSLLHWVVSFLGIIDVLAVLPYYIEIMLQQDTSVLFRFSILRMFRLMRVFRPFRYNNTILLTIEVMYLSIHRSQHALLAISFFVVMVLSIFSTLLYFAERGTWDPTLETFVNIEGDPTQFSSIPAAAWFVLVTITTVGYGEITPRSFLGKLFTLPLLVFGLLLIALPSFVLGREFSIVWEKMTNRERLYHDDIIESPVQSFHPPSAVSATSASKDLSNKKLAQNQTELSQQITELRNIVESQSETLHRLLVILKPQELEALSKTEGKRRKQPA